MTPNDNIATIRAALAAFNANDVAALERLVDDLERRDVVEGGHAARPSLERA